MELNATNDTDHACKPASTLADCTSTITRLLADTTIFDVVSGDDEADGDNWSVQLRIIDPSLVEV